MKKTIIIIGMLLVSNICYADWQDFNRNLSGRQFENRSDKGVVLLNREGVIVPVQVDSCGTTFYRDSNGSVEIMAGGGRTAIIDSNGNLNTIYDNQ